ncbi:MAG: hypothetical protein ACYCQI_07510, partial [Gammaproteobacteria bacterium]
KESKAPSPTVDLKGLKLLFSSEWEIAKPLHKDLIKKTHELFINQDSKPNLLHFYFNWYQFEENSQAKETIAQLINGTLKSMRPEQIDQKIKNYLLEIGLHPALVKETYQLLAKYNEANFKREGKEEVDKTLAKDLVLTGHLPAIAFLIQNIGVIAKFGNNPYYDYLCALYVLVSKNSAAKANIDAQIHRMAIERLKNSGPLGKKYFDLIHNQNFQGNPHIFFLQNITEKNSGPLYFDFMQAQRRTLGSKEAKKANPGFESLQELFVKDKLLRSKASAPPAEPSADFDSTIFQTIKHDEAKATPPSAPPAADDDVRLSEEARPTQQLPVEPIQQTLAQQDQADLTSTMTREEPEDTITPLIKKIEKELATSQLKDKQSSATSLLTEGGLSTSAQSHIVSPEVLQTNPLQSSPSPSVSSQAVILEGAQAASDQPAPKQAVSIQSTTLQTVSIPSISLPSERKRSNPRVVSSPVDTVSQTHIDKSVVAVLDSAATIQSKTELDIANELEPGSENDVAITPGSKASPAVKEAAISKYPSFFNVVQSPENRSAIQFSAEKGFTLECSPLRADGQFTITFTAPGIKLSLESPEETTFTFKKPNVGFFQPQTQLDSTLRDIPKIADGLQRVV